MTPSPNKKIIVVEALRGLAALGVAWFHLTNTYGPGLVRASGAFGWAGVDIFFVISGFVIPYSIGAREHGYRIYDFPRFLLRRIIRLDPPYIASIALVIVLWHVSALMPGFRGQPPTIEPAQILAHLLYLIPLTDFHWLQPVYWSLAYEFAFYIFIGLTFNLVEARNHNAAWICAVAITISLVIGDLLNERVLLFALGISIYRAVLGESQHALPNLVAATAATAVLAWNDVTSAFAGGAAACTIFFLHAARPSGWIALITTWFGGISYSLYLLHVPIGGRIVNLGRRFIESELGLLALSIVALLVSIIGAIVFRRLIESPAIKWSRLF